MTPFPRSILVLRLSALGDIIHTVPSVNALRDANPGVAIGWLVEAPYADLVRLVAPVDEVFTVATRRWRRAKLAAGTRGEIASLGVRLQRFAWGQASIDFQGLMKSSLFALMAGASRRYCFSWRAIREKPARFLGNRPVDIDQSKHVVEWNLALARAAGAASGPPRFDLSRLPHDPEGRLTPLVQSRPVVLFPGAGRPEKLWGAERFRALARSLARDASRRVIVVWGPGEEALAHEIAAGGDAEVAPPTDLRELAFLLRHAGVVVAGDTGPLHVAAAFDTPVVGLFGPTNPARNGPWGQLERCVESWTTTRRMDSIEPAAVFNVVEQALVSDLVR
ncbi:MAG: lipopolysaccharide heptosyltransferase I [Acidobacteria bacterium]|nr:lipopolysaccharide heptosyltransferase I [Acidobacteriota bacterium]